MISGFATSDGTSEFTRTHKMAGPNHFKKFEGLWLSSIGMGTYLGNSDEATDLLVRDAVIKSINLGVNVIDTAINYRSQKAERSVGKAISQMVKEGLLKREQVFISTKNGYTTNDGDIKQDFWENIQDTLVKTGVIKSGDISSGYHCMTIPFLKDQLKRSLRNLGLESIDLIYLHNAAEGQLQDISKDEFMKRIGKVFEFYEDQRRLGTIRYYGMATWDCFRVPPDHPQYLSIFEIVNLAKEISGPENGFKFIQLPYNMYLDQALVLKNQSNEGSVYSILEAAAKLGIGVFTSVPLMQSKLLEPNVLPEFGGLSHPSHRAIQFVRSTPGVICPLVGHKSESHIEENLEMVRNPILDEKEFFETVRKLSR